MLSKLSPDRNNPISIKYHSPSDFLNFEPNPNILPHNPILIVPLLFVLLFLSPITTLCVYVCVYPFCFLQTSSSSSSTGFVHFSREIKQDPSSVFREKEREMEGERIMEGNSSSSTRRELRALVVDDQEMLRNIHERMLNNLGVKNVEAVGNGKEAVDINRAGRSFDLILMDLDMPIMNGIEATRELRAMGVKSKIAGVSARSEEARVQEFIGAGLDLFLEKPLTSEKLSSLVRHISPL